jgi:hypothetical protein
VHGECKCMYLNPTSFQLRGSSMSPLNCKKCTGLQDQSNKKHHEEPGQMKDIISVYQ